MTNLISNLEKNGFEVVSVATKEEALEVAKKFVKEGESVGLGGSTSVSECGLLAWLVGAGREGRVELFNQYEEGITKDEDARRRRMGLVSDVYFCSTNAVSGEGWLVNADGSGNRVAALNFGPKKVVLVVGKNKICGSLEEAVERVKSVAAVKNMERFAKKGVKFACADELVKKISVIKGDVSGRICVILVDDELGF